VTAGHDGNEGRRQAYLAALGIPLWASRRELPGALPASPLEVVPYVAAEEVGRFEVVPEPVESAAPPVPTTSAPPIPAPRVAEAPAPASTPPPPAAEALQFPKFVCRVQALAPGYSAVVSLGDAPDLAAAEHRLLANIAQALGGEAVSTPPCEHLRWPLNRNPTLDHSTGAMIEWLAHALRLSNSHCLVFGEELAGYVRTALPQINVTAAPGLAELLQSPSAKSGLWKALHG
jgi:hypothetical protein